MTDQIQPKQIEINGISLHYIEQGTGDPLILVHGSLGDLRAWPFQIEPFSQHYHVISYSRRYHYPNTWVGDGRDYSASLHAEDLAAFIRKLGLGPVYLVGHSYGAYTSLILAIRHPELVRKIVLGEPPILLWLEHIPGGHALLETFMNNVWRPAGQAFLNGTLEQGIRLFIDGINGQGEFDQLPSSVQSRMLDNGLEMKAETQAPEQFQLIAVDDVRRMAVPSLLLRGQRTAEMFSLIIDELARLLPNKDQAVIPNATHSMPAGNPEVYNQNVLAFLAGP